MSASKLVQRLIFRSARSHVGGSSSQPSRLCAHTAYATSATTHGGSHANYDDAFNEAINNPDEFWAKAAEDIVWMKKWDCVLDNSNPPFTKWFVGGKLNACYNTVDRHVEHGFGNQLALIHDSPVTNSKQYITYKRLMDEVSKFAGVLVRRGCRAGDVVLIYMPMIPQAIITMLACARIGAIHSVVFGGFSAKELSVRMQQYLPRYIVTASYGVERNHCVLYKPIVDEAIKLAGFRPKASIIYNRDAATDAFSDVVKTLPMTPGIDYDWNEEMSSSKGHDCVELDANHPIYILGTSGTTGIPKAPVRPTAGYCVALAWSMYNIYGMRPHDVWWAASDLGWVVGHSYICYAPLLHGNTSVIYEGKPVGTPDASALFRVISDHDVNGLFIAPTALRAVRQVDRKCLLGSKYKETWRDFRYVFVAGEHCTPATMKWTEDTFGVPVFDNWWQTETGWAITSSHVGLGDPLHPPRGFCGKPVPGYNVKVLRADHSEAGPKELGTIVVKLPLPPGNFSTLWNNDDGFVKKYFLKFPGYYDSQDVGIVNEDGYVAVQSRADDVINVAGHRISCGAVEEAVMKHGDVVECAVIGVNDSLKGSVPLGLCILRDDARAGGRSGIGGRILSRLSQFLHLPQSRKGAMRGGRSRKDVHEDAVSAGADSPVPDPDHIVSGIIELVREEIGPVASFKKVLIVQRLPKTRSGKIARQTIADLANNKPYKIPVTIDDASVMPELEESLKTIGLATNSPGPIL